jgi:1,4-alpha-glucan branching enzyme
VRTANDAAGRWGALYERSHEAAGFQWLDADDAASSIYGFLRWSADSRQVVACLANLTPVPREDYLFGLPWAGHWQVLLNSDDERFGGSGYGGVGGVEADKMSWQGQPASARINLPPLAVIWLGAGE